MSNEAVAETTNLTKHFPLTKTFLPGFLAGKQRKVRAVEGVNIKIHKGEILGLVGESGCGKSTLGRLMLKLIEPTSGVVRLFNVDITKAKRGRMRGIRRRAQMIFQDPYSSLPVRLTARDIVLEPFKIHGIPQKDQSSKIAENLLESVDLKPGYVFLSKHPNELSGGQRQRVAIARAIALNPEFLVADEPVSMLDVSVSGGILHLIKRLRKELGLAILFITHDLSVAKYTCDRIAVMYVGNIVEQGATEKVLDDPRHPYTKLLRVALPRIGSSSQRKELPVRDVEIANPVDPPSGCRFHPRCPFAMSRCSIDEPRLVEVDDQHFVACYL